jgi:uncharacterized OsmC-like protein
MTRTAEEQIVQRPTVTVRPAPGRTKLVTVPVDGEVPMGVRGEIAEHYRVPVAELTPHATTLDYLIGAAAGCLTGTFSGMLLALGQATHDDRLAAQAEGVIVNERGVLRIRSIHVTYRLRRDADIDIDKIERAHDRHQRHCPVASSIGSAIEITSELVVV